jgi:hypothetical protein
MAIHPNLQSMLNESLPEMLLVAKYSIEFHKDTNIWSAPGCYGYPAALLLLSIADSLGSYIEQKKVENHFKILNNPDFYGLNLTDEELRVIFDNYRNLLSHNTVMATNVGLNIGSPSDNILEKKGDQYWLNLVPFYDVSVKAVNSFLNNPGVLRNNLTLLNLYKKH